MKNSILLLVFNYSDCLNNKQKICDLYKDHFKKIIIYSDIPKNTNEQLHEDVNYVDIHRGFFVHRIFNHFYDNYKSDINECDGMFYTMDDMIINTNILHLYDAKKIIYFHQKIEKINEHKPDWGRWLAWRERVAKLPLEKHGIAGFASKPSDLDIDGSTIPGGGFADFFYLPKKYLTKKLFDLFHLFSDIFLEISIPTIIANIEKSKDHYSDFDFVFCRGDDRKQFENGIFVKKALKNNALLIHPIKFGQNPKSFDFLNDIFRKKKCVIITTINEPTETIRKHINNTEYDVIIVGDLKTPDTYKNEDCIFLDIKNQQKLFPELCDLIPYNHYGRKNLGYLYAVKKGYDVIYETDDDNIPHDNFDVVTNFDTNIKTIKDEGSEWINIFKFFTNNSWIWPRGYPLSNIKQNPHPDFKFDNSKNKEDVAIINGLVENDPDVDAIFRLVCNHSVKWEKDKKIIISNQNTCPFNTQNTFWVDPELFIGLLIPCSVTFRYCDILKGIIANTLLKSNNKNMAYTSPNVTQLRNEHDLMKDFESEVPMYLANETIVSEINESIFPEQKCLYLIQASEGLPRVYQHFKNEKEFVLLSYKNKTQDTDIFSPNSTWTTGRNALRDYALKLDKEYDYYIFLDEDIVFTESNTFDDFELLLNKYKPNIGSPTILGYGHEKFNPPIDVKLNNRSVLFYDGCCNAFSRKAFLSDQIFPYIDKFDDTNWCSSQYIMIMRCHQSENDVYVFNDLAVANTQHGKYPRSGDFANAEEYLKRQYKISIDEISFTKSKCKIIDSNFNKKLMLNIYQKMYDKKIIAELDLEILNVWLKYFR